MTRIKRSVWGRQEKWSGDQAGIWLGDSRAYPTGTGATLWLQPSESLKIAALAAASGFNAVTVFALYISSDTVRQLYRHPIALWLICPILMYWLGRALMMAHRRLIDDDPILFALKDWNSLAALCLIGAILIGAAMAE